VTLGLPEDKAAVYQTRIEAENFWRKSPADKSGEISPCQSAGGEEIHTNQTPLPRQTNACWSVGKLQ